MHPPGVIWTLFRVDLDKPILYLCFMKQVVIIVPECDVNLSSVTGPLEVLKGANAYWQRRGNRSSMEIRIAGLTKERVIGDGYLSLHPVAIQLIDQADLIIIPSLSADKGFDHLVNSNTELAHWLKAQYKSGAEIASICTGAFLLAATGLLDGKTCSTHWNAEHEFRRMFPKIDLHIDQLITARQGIYTNGGAYSFLNLMLFLVERYFDRETAIFCAKTFQIDLDRTSQSPFFIFEPQKSHGDEMINKAQAYLEKNLSEKISFEHLASELAISRRNFDRRFIKATGNTPVEYLQRLKVEVAKNALEKGRKSIFEIMLEVGYADDKAFREVFRRITGLSPLDYRARFNQESVLA